MILKPVFDRGAPAIILVGLPGSGKTTVGKALARRLRITFTDSDAVVQKTLGTTIAEHFAVRGESSFRAVEQAVLGELLRDLSCVLATGGGVVLSEANRAAIRASGAVVVYLNASVNDIARRIRPDGQRPMFRDGAASDTLAKLAVKRHPLYLSVATIVVNSAQETSRIVVDDILTRLNCGPLESPPR